MKEDPSSISCRCSKRILHLLLVLICGLLLVGCTNQELENDLYNSKTLSIEDNKKVESIVSSLNYHKNFTYDKSEIINKEPYGIRIYLNETIPKLDLEFLEEAAIIFSLVDDVENISFVSEKRGQILDSYKREDVDKILEKNYNLDTRKIGSNKEEFNKYLMIRRWEIIFFF